MTVLESRPATEADMPKTVAAAWARMAPFTRRAHYAHAMLDNGQDIESIGLRAHNTAGRNVWAVWERRLDKATPKWQAALCWAWTSQPGSLGKLYVNKIGPWLESGERQAS